MRKINKLIAEKHADACVCCGAKARVGFNTCDGVCHRAHVRGIDRGIQMELETRRDNQRPYPERREMEYEADVLTGEQFFMLEWEALTNRMFDNPARVA